MITDCPACHRQFRIHAWQLSAARGLVQCGFCGRQFNALERLYDRPLPQAGDDPVTGGVTVDEPQFDIPERNPVSDEPDTYPEQDNSEPVENDESGADLRSGRVSEYDNETLARELEGLPREKRSVRGLIFWMTGVICLFVILALQFAWFNRDTLLDRYPRFRPMARELCERYGCEVVREHKLDSIVLINRDVRDHPRFIDTLLVNATMENQSGSVQPYPGIRLTLYDTEGNITGYRVFRPAEYLDDSIDIEAGMPSGIPVHLVLEISGAAETAVSFEFHFI